MLSTGLNTIMIENKYTKLYYKITSNAKQRITNGYTELHHIIPQSMGGSNDKENLVELTAREHFICHWLLIKMTEGEDRSKMLYALNGMKAENKYQQRYHTKITARVYEKYRIEHAENHSKRMKGRKAWNKGVPQTEEHKEKNRQAALQRAPKSEKTITKVKTHGANVANAVLGNISINKDDVEKKVKKDTLQSYLDQGWHLGGKKRKIA